MNKQDTLDRIRDLGLLAVLRGPSVELTHAMVAALVDAGVLGIEITFTTPSAAEVVRSLDKRYGDRIMLGMGTLTKPEHAFEAREAGARFLVSPHLDDELAAAMVETGRVVMLGALTPTEVMRAVKLGSDVVKIFPGSLVGPGYLRALRGPFPELPLMPTGGVAIDNVDAWFSAGAFAVGAGSDLCPPAWAKEGRFDDITANAVEFMRKVQSARKTE